MKYGVQGSNQQAVGDITYWNVVKSWKEDGHIQRRRPRCQQRLKFIKQSRHGELINGPTEFPASFDTPFVGLVHLAVTGKLEAGFLQYLFGFVVVIFFPTCHVA